MKPATAIANRSLWYREEVTKHERALVAPMGGERDRNERAAAEIARALYERQFGEPVPARCPFRCDWDKNPHGQTVIRAVRFVRAGVFCNPIEIPGWRGHPLPPPEEPAPGVLL